MMLKKCYTYELTDGDKITGSGCVYIWFWQSAYNAYSQASSSMRWRGTAIINFRRIK